MRTRREQVTAALARVLGAATAVGLLSTSTLTQSPSVEDRILVTVTGSNIIPRIEGETGLPVQVITREEIERANIQTAFELLNTVSANMSFGAYNEVQSLGPPRDRRALRAHRSAAWVRAVRSCC